MFLRIFLFIPILVFASVATDEQIRNIENDEIVVIKSEFYSTIEQLGEHLSKNENVTSLTIYTDHGYTEKSAYENVKSVAQEGLKNKPNLASFKIIGDFSPALFFNLSYKGDKHEERDNIIRDVKKAKDNPDYSWFFNLIRLNLHGDVKSSMSELDWLHKAYKISQITTIESTDGYITSMFHK